MMPTSTGTANMPGTLEHCHARIHEIRQHFTIPQLELYQLQAGEIAFRIKVVETDGLDIMPRCNLWLQEDLNITLHVHCRFPICATEPLPQELTIEN